MKTREEKLINLLYMVDSVTYKVRVIWLGVNSLSKGRQFVNQWGLVLTSELLFFFDFVGNQIIFSRFA